MNRKDIDKLIEKYEHWQNGDGDFGKKANFHMINLNDMT